MISNIAGEGWAMPVREQAFQDLALGDPEGHWELHCGELRRKPEMTLEHNSLGYWLSVQIATQVDRTRFDVRFNAGHVSRSPENYYIPDVMVMPVDLHHPDRLPFEQVSFKLLSV